MAKLRPTFTLLIALACGPATAMAGQAAVDREETGLVDRIEVDPQGAVTACARIVSPEQFRRIRRREAIEPVVNRIRIGRRRGLQWNGAAIGPERLKQYFAITTAMIPVPYLVIRIDRDADAGLVRRARDAIQLSAGCPPSALWVPR